MHAVEMNPYRASIIRIVEAVGLENYGCEEGRMPPRSAEENDRIAEHLPSVLRAEQEKEERLKGKNIPSRTRKKKLPNNVADAMEDSVDAAGRGTRTIYLSFEESVEWKAFLQSLPAMERHRATVRRRVSLALWRAHSKRDCLWCWFPQSMCLCSKLDTYRALLPQKALRDHVEVTMLLHSEELMRSTNSGHIAAYLLGAPLRVWGLEADDAYLERLEGVAEQADATSGVPYRQYNVSLYPEKNAPLIGDFIKGVAAAERPAAGHPLSRIHLVLSDSTWGQALSLNRHIPRSVPRVALQIDDTYESLFAALRKRTRESGVSTLEATTMAVDQCIRALGLTEEAQRTSEVVTGAMKEFVDLKCLLKFSAVQFTTDHDKIDELEEKRDVFRRAESVDRLARLSEKIQKDPKARQYLLPPVTNYCYCCDCVVGWHRMAEHALGKTHRMNLAKNPTCEPSVLSKTQVVEDFSRPLRSERAKHALSTNGSSGEEEEEEGDS